MEQFWIEGLYVTRRGLKKAQKSGRVNPADIEPYARLIWANSAEEALRLATEELKGGQWMEGPRLGKTSEERRMRQQGAPELPGFTIPKKKRKK